MIAGLALCVSGCVTIYSKDREWRLPAGLGDYVLSARITGGFFVREAVISVNGRQILEGRSYLWSNTISMASTIDALPISAVCNRRTKSCNVAIGGFHSVALTF